MKLVKRFFFFIFLFLFPFFAMYQILISSRNVTVVKKKYFVILVIAGYGGTRQVIRKTVEGDDLFEKVQLKDLISEEKQSRVLIQMTTGLLKSNISPPFKIIIIRCFPA